MLQKFLAAVLAAVVVVCATLGTAQTVPTPGRQIIDDVTTNPAVGECRFGNYQAALLVVSVDDGTHAVTVQTRACASCPWVTEGGLAATVTAAAPLQFRVIGWFERIRITVANAGGDTVNAWCSLH